MKFGRGVLYSKLSSKPEYRHVDYVTATIYVCINFWPQCPHLLSDVGEIRYTTSARNAVFRVRASWKSALRRLYVSLTVVNEMVFSLVVWSAMPSRSLCSSYVTGSLLLNSGGSSQFAVSCACGKMRHSSGMVVNDRRCCCRMSWGPAIWHLPVTCYTSCKSFC